MDTYEGYYDYDGYGNVGKKYDRNGNTLQYTYGAYGVKLEETWFAGGIKNKYTYNGVGQLTKTESYNKNGDTVEESYSYDPFGRMTSKTSADGTVQTYTYDSNSNILSYDMAKGDETKNNISYEYDGLNRLTRLTNNDKIFRYNYDANGNLTFVRDETRARFDITISYNKLNLPTSYRSNYYKGKEYNYSMSYYLNGQKYQESDVVNGTVKGYEYNSLGQLSMERETKNNSGVYTANYTYNPYGNRTQMTYHEAGGGTEVTDYTYDANNRLTLETNSIDGDVKGTTRYYYDDSGNTIAEQKSVYTTTGTTKSNMSLSGHSGGSTMKIYKYDELNRLIKYNDDGAEATYTYGAGNLRAAKTVNGSKTTYVWNGQNLAGETKNGTTTAYTYDVTGVIASKTDNDTLVRFIKDPHGNRLLWD